MFPYLTHVAIVRHSLASLILPPIVKCEIAIFEIAAVPPEGKHLEIVAAFLLVLSPLGQGVDHHVDEALGAQFPIMEYTVCTYFLSYRRVLETSIG